MVRRLLKSLGNLFSSMLPLNGLKCPFKCQVPIDHHQHPRQPNQGRAQKKPHHQPPINQRLVKQVAGLEKSQELKTYDKYGQVRAHFHNLAITVGQEPGCVRLRSHSNTYPTLELQTLSDRLYEPPAHTGTYKPVEDAAFCR
jgi:hypothetical protein